MTYEHLMTGGALGREDFIHEHMRLVAKLVSHYLRRHQHLGHLKEDIRSAATIGLVKATDRLLVREKPKSISGFIMRAMQKTVQDWIDKEQTIYVPTRTKTRSKKQNKPIITPKVERLAIEPTVDMDAAHETLCDLLTLCESDVERRIVRLKADGNSSRSVSKQLKISRETITAILLKLRTRWEEQNADD
jgi:RNA polymerase sigma factor (sigma-70 family)